MRARATRYAAALFSSTVHILSKIKWRTAKHHGRTCTEARVVNSPRTNSPVSPPIPWCLFSHLRQWSRRNDLDSRKMPAASGSKFQFYNVNSIFPLNPYASSIVHPPFRSRYRSSRSIHNAFPHRACPIRTRNCENGRRNRFFLIYREAEYYTWKWSTMAHCVRALITDVLCLCQFP